MLQTDLNIFQQEIVVAQYLGGNNAVSMKRIYGAPAIIIRLPAYQMGAAVIEVFPITVLLVQIVSIRQQIMIVMTHIVSHWNVIP